MMEKYGSHLRLERGLAEEKADLSAFLLRDGGEKMLFSCHTVSKKRSRKTKTRGVVRLSYKIITMKKRKREKEK